MSMNFKEFEVKNLNETFSFEWNGKNINILKNLSMDNKYDIIMISLQESQENGYYNPILLDMYFHLNLVYIYTDIIFDDEDKEEPGRIYDVLKQSGFMDKFLSVINEKDYNDMFEALEEIQYKNFKYNCSLSSIVKKLIDDLPANAKAAMDIVDNFNPEKYQAVQNFAKAANGGRDIKS